eukprot:2626921-Prymnesium_polylepis.2
MLRWSRLRRRFPRQIQQDSLTDRVRPVRPHQLHQATVPLTHRRVVHRRQPGAEVFSHTDLAQAAEHGLDGRDVAHGLPCLAISQHAQGQVELIRLPVAACEALIVGGPVGPKVQIETLQAREAIGAQRVDPPAPSRRRLEEAYLVASVALGVDCEAPGRVDAGPAAADDGKLAPGRDCWWRREGRHLIRCCGSKGFERLREEAECEQKREQKRSEKRPVRSACAEHHGGSVCDASSCHG